MNNMQKAKRITTLFAKACDLVNEDPFRNQLKINRYIKALDHYREKYKNIRLPKENN